MAAAAAEDDDFTPAAYLKAKKLEEAKLASSNKAADKERIQIGKEQTYLEQDALRASKKALETLQTTEELASKASDELQYQGTLLDEADTKIKLVDVNADANYKTAKNVKRQGHFLSFLYGRRAKIKGELDKEYALKQSEIDSKKLRHEVNKQAIDEHGMAAVSDIEDFSPAKSPLNLKAWSTGGKRTDTVSMFSSDVSSAVPVVVEIHKSETDKQIDENLDQIDSAVERLKIIGAHMAEEMDRQSLVMNSIDATREHTLGTLVRAQAKIEKYST